MVEKFIDESYLHTQILTDEDIILNFPFIYGRIVAWVESLNLKLSVMDVYKAYISGTIKNDGTPFFYNFIKVCKYMEVNKIYGFHIS